MGLGPANGPGQAVRVARISLPWLALIG